MIDKSQSIKVTAVLFVVVAGAQLAFARSGPQRTLPQNVTTVTSTQMSRPGNGILAIPPERLISAPLTENECTGLGGTTAPIQTSQCATGKKCVVADKDGVISSACITVK